MIRKSAKRAMATYPENSEGYHFGTVPLRMRLAVVDMNVLFEKLLNETDPDAQNLLARTLSTHFYEFFEDVPAMLGKKFRTVIQRFPPWEKVEADLNILVSSFNDTKRACIERHKLVRHNVGAHRDEDGMLQAKIIDNISMEWTVSDYFRLAEWIVNYLDFEFRIAVLAERIMDGTYKQ
ncbi:hypothetical protein [Mucilaginibacter segetis]|uniref:HEPN AbiU2-like domain-containing protein n=1 Tax=Mucilaginibacter segetis TaxID=2793071 RepID=A0A934PTK4_9SPHI|nr:hypothetical protein [Mucilaginibacter segetis]MBK0379337.1 hypothetical protein [Mucilaginibacter segetis]